MKAAISGIGAWYPAHVRTNAFWPESFAANGKRHGDRTFNDIPRGIDEAARVSQKYLEEEALDPFLGVTERRFADVHTSAVDAEVSAGALALADAGVEPKQVDAVISYSMVPDGLMPGSSGAVALRLGIANALAFQMDAACATLTPQIACAAALVSSGQARHVLITQSHLLLRALPHLHPASPGLGDAATAIVVSGTGKWPIVAWHGVTDGAYHRAVTWVRERAELPDQAGETGGEAGDVAWYLCGGAYRLGSHDRAQAKQLMRDTVSVGAKTVVEVCEKAGVGLDKIGLFASVEPRGWIPKAMAEVLDLRTVVIPSVYATRGHLGACGPLANLESASREGLSKRASFAALYAQGAGFTRSAVLLEMMDL